MIIDIHHHWCPPEVYDSLEKILPPGEQVIWRRGIPYIYRGEVGIMPVHRRHTELEAQIRDLDEVGVDRAVFSLGILWEYTTLPMCRRVNEALAEAVRRYPTRIIGLAHGPVLTEEGLREIERGLRDLGLKGIGMVSHTKGMYLDEEAFFPLYELASRYRAPIFVHAAGVPLDYQALMKYDLVRTLGRTFDHTIAVSRILHSGLLHKFPGLRFIIPKLGGAFFIQMGRLFSSTYEIAEGDWRTGLDQIVFDTSTPYWTKPELTAAVQTLGAHRLAMGSDYPVHFEKMGTGEMRKAVELIDELDIPPSQKQAIRGGTAARLFHLEEAGRAD